jgi:hypothetical protein
VFYTCPEYFNRFSGGETEGVIMAFDQAERTQLYLRCALFGPSGSGKTMTALRMAKGIADTMGVPFAVIDTEARSASKYADRIPFVVDNLKGKTVDDYIASMNDCINAGYKVLGIDSLSHAWRELTDEVDRIAQNSNSKNNFSPWAKVNPKQKRFIDAILNFPGHVIATMRSNTDWVIGTGKNGKAVPEKVGLKPEQGKDIEYEFDLLIEMDQKHQAVITKDRTGKFQDETLDKPGEAFGVSLYGWLTGSEASSPPLPPPVINQHKETGNQLIKEIGQIITLTAAKGVPYFNELEKADAKKLIRETRCDEGESKRSGT